MNHETTLLPCPFCGSTRAPEISDVGECEECVRFDDCLHRQKNHSCEGCDEWERPMFVVCNYNISGCGTSGPYRKTRAEAIAAWNTRAELGSGTCRITASATDGLCSDNPRIWFKLSCGHSFTLDGLGAPVACAVCGKTVKR